VKESFHLVSPPPIGFKACDGQCPSETTGTSVPAYLLINEARRKWEQLQAIKQDVFQGSLGKEGNVPSITLGTP